jgi:hypothetical protein
MGAPLTHFLSFSFLTQVEGLSHLEIMAPPSNHGSNSMEDSFSTSESNSSCSSSSSDDGMQEMFANMDRRDNVFLQLQLLLPTHPTCSMPMN